MPKGKAATTKAGRANKPTGKAKAPRYVFADPGRSGAIRWIEQLEAELQAYLRAKPGSKPETKALAPLLARAFDAKTLQPRLGAFKAAAVKLKATKLRLSGFDLRVTLWHHRVPVRDLDLSFFRAGDHGLQLLRFLTHRTYHRFFGGPPILPRSTPAELAMGGLADQVVALAQTQKCDTLPVVSPEHLNDFLPRLESSRKQTLFNFHKSRHRQKGHCNKTSKLPHTRVTFRIAGVGGILIDTADERHAIRLRMMPRPDGSMNMSLLTLADPVSPKPKGPPRRPRPLPKP